MTDQEREERALWMLSVSECIVERRGGWWLIADGGSAVFLRVGTLTALVALADMRYANVWHALPIMPSA